MNDVEIIINQQFCQFKEVIRGSDQHLIIGIEKGDVRAERA